MSKLPSISVIVPAYNEERFIGRCLRSLLNQSYPRDDFEVIVIDDASSDRTSFALELFRDEIILIENSTRVGLPASLNRGIRKARGRFIVRVDADDYVHSDYLKILEMFLSLNPGLDAVACDYVLVDDHESVIEQVDCMAAPIGCGIMFRVDQLVDIGLYDESFLAREEEDLRIRFLSKHNIARVQLPLYRYRRHAGNMTNEKAAMEEYRRQLEQKHRKDEGE